jgi:hypothetical protein
VGHLKWFTLGLAGNQQSGFIEAPEDYSHVISFQGPS